MQESSLKNRVVRFASLTIALAVFIASAGAEESSPREQLDFFEMKIRPLLVQRCQKCHGDNMQKGQLRLDSQTALAAGGESGSPAVVPGKPDESPLIQAVRHESGKMPPDGKLADDDIAALVAWVRIGAPWPKEGEAKVAVRPRKVGITDDDRSWWSFQPVQRPAVPQLTNDSWSRNSIDRFVLARLRAEGIRPSAEADPRTLLRRLKADLIGLPVDSVEADAFAADRSPDAFEAAVDRNLNDPRYGERWGRHWLDLVRYAESDGYKQDAYRPTAWRYRDYVIRAFNQDKPYDRFVREQLAGDEMETPDADAVIATGYLRAGIYEYNQRDVTNQWDSILNEMTDVTADVFLGLSLGCAKCHDHKYDPLLQKDYFRLRAVFTPVMLRDALVAASDDEVKKHEQSLAAWEEKTAALRIELEALEQVEIDRVAKKPIDKFPDQVRSIFSKPESLRSPLEQQWAALAWRQVEEEIRKIDYSKALKGEAKERWEQLKKELAALDTEKPSPLPSAIGVSDVGPESPVTFVQGRRMSDDLVAGPPAVVSETSFENYAGPARSGSTRRRSALAAWITDKSNPLTARVLVNRVWQFHFGRGLVPTGSDFGKLGTPPTHPELLDWLAAEFMDSGYSIKHLHRLILTSATYRQSSHGSSAADSFTKDAANQWWGRTNIRRLDAELIRDAMLHATGELQSVAGGPSVESKVARRTVYTKVMRNTCDPLVEEFDAPDNILPTPLRNSTVTPNQSLLLINGGWVLQRAKSLASSAAAAAPVADDRIVFVYRRVLGREPSPTEKDAALAYFYEHPAKNSSNGSGSNEALVDFCHVLLNANEFLYVD